MPVCRIACVALLAIGLEAASAFAGTLRAVRHITRPAVTTLILEFSEPVQYRLRRAAAAKTAGVPPRLYLDLPNTRLSAGTVIPRHLPEGPLRRVRAGERPSGIRLILDVPGLTDYGAFPMHDPFRLVVDVRAAGATAPGKADGVAAAQTVAVQGERARAPETVPRKRFKVVVDPGHGGKDPGAIGPDGVAEKDVVLAIARQLRRALQSTANFDVVLTRDGDTYVSLEARTARANAEDADLFLSIHANASPNRKRSGAETYYLNDTEDQATLRLARMENGLRNATGENDHDRDVAVILSSLIQNYKVEESTALAEEVQRGLVQALRANGTPVQDLGVKRGPFYVLVGAGMPCVLVEVSFITHPREGPRLSQPAYQKAVARGLLQGLTRFVENTQVAQNL